MPYEIQALLGQLVHGRHLNRVSSYVNFLFAKQNNIIMEPICSPIPGKKIYCSNNPGFWYCQIVLTTFQRIF